jgi:hypothetical protein
MSPFENIVGAIHDLSYEEKLKLRTVLDDELKVASAEHAEGIERAKRIIGLFADEPELMDQVLEAAYEQRSLPLRLDRK